MRAYAILEGGGVLGAALAGCLDACDDMGIEFVGYAGTSAGSLVATLAASGYSSRELKQIMEEVDFSSFLDDGGRSLTSLSSLLAGPLPFKVWKSFAQRKLLGEIFRDFGVYHGRDFKNFLLRLLRKKLELPDGNSITFRTLSQAGCRPLKVIATDVGLKRAVVFSALDTDAEVADAVRASISYPFVFKPVRTHDRLLVDGGIASNLPVHVFEQERRRDRVPLIVFDLVGPPVEYESKNKGLLGFCKDMISSSIESHSLIQLEQVQGVYHVRVEIPNSFDVLDFAISQDRRKQLFLLGREAAFSYFNSQVPFWGQARDEAEMLQSQRNIEPDVVEELLASIAQDIGSLSAAENLRCAIMLPTSRNTRLVTYQYNMDSDADLGLELPTEAGCTGNAWTQRVPVFADLDEARRHPEDWGLSMTQRNRVPERQRAMVGVPLFDLRYRLGHSESMRELGLLGTLSLDSSTSLPNTRWLTGSSPNPEIVERLIYWAAVVSKVIG